jgi:Winged helix-turn helix
MFARAQALTIGEEQKNQLEALIRSGSTPQRIARRCQVVLMASQGLSNHLIAQQTGLSRPTVLAARAAFGKRGTAGICEPQKRKRSRRILTPETGATDSGHDAENQTRGRDSLERARAGCEVGCFPHDGPASLAAL